MAFAALRHGALRGCARASVAHRPAASAFAPTTIARANFSDDGHDDFKPKRKAMPDMGNEDEVLALIDEHVKSHPVLLYMKGTPSAPQCGFSQQVVRVMHSVGVDFSSINVLEHQEIREGIKKYSDWPTIPQLYVDGEFVGGCDIITAEFQSGDLAKLLEEKGLIEAEK